MVVDAEASEPLITLDQLEVGARIVEIPPDHEGQKEGDTGRPKRDRLGVLVHHLLVAADHQDETGTRKRQENNEG